MKKLFIALLLASSINLFACQFAKTELEKTFLKAAREDNGELVKECLKKGVNPNVQDRITGDSALHYLLSHRGVDFAEATSYTFKCISAARLNALNLLFLHRHADVNIRNTITGDTPLHIAARAPINIIETANRIPVLLKGFRIPPNETFYFTTMSTERFIADYSSIFVAALLSKGANPALCNYFNKLPIHSTISRGAFEQLLEARNKVDYKIILQLIRLRKVILMDKHLSFSIDYRLFQSAIKAKNFNPDIARLALIKIEKKYITTFSELGGKDDDTFTDDIKNTLAPCRKLGRALIYYCTLFNILQSPEPHDPQKQGFPVFPKEIVHHYFAVPATQFYLEKTMQAKENIGHYETLYD